MLKLVLRTKKRRKKTNTWEIGFMQSPHNFPHSKGLAVFLRCAQKALVASPFTARELIGLLFITSSKPHFFLLCPFSNSFAGLAPYRFPCSCLPLSPSLSLARFASVMCSSVRTLQLGWDRCALFLSSVCCVSSLFSPSSSCALFPLSPCCVSSLLSFRCASSLMSICGVRSCSSFGYIRFTPSSCCVWVAR